MKEKHYNPDIHHRRSIRLKEYDYSQNGLYFVTVCVQEKQHLFGEIKDEKMMLNEVGRMVEVEWKKIINRFNNLELHDYVIMPNHFHAIIEIKENKSLERRYRLGDILGAFQSITTVNYIRAVKEHNWPAFHDRLWQRNYYEQIIRNEDSYRNIQHYIITNPQKWDSDAYYP